jgi:hypothetical protein
MILTFFNKQVLLHGRKGYRYFRNFFIAAIVLPLWGLSKKDLNDHFSKFNQTSFNDSAYIRFNTTVISFGRAKAGERIIKEFRFQNTGRDTLKIISVMASDGGTIAYWPHKPVAPGAKNVIKVKFGYTRSRSGFQDKLFTVISNAQNNIVVLHLEGNIKKD